MEKFSGYFKFPTEEKLEDYQIHIDCNGWSDRNYGVFGEDQTRSDFRLLTKEQLDEFIELAQKHDGKLTLILECDSPLDRGVAVATRMFFCNIDSDEQALAVYTDVVSRASEDPDCHLGTDEYPLWSAVEREPASEVITLLDYLADDVCKAIVGYSNHFPTSHPLMRGCTSFMWCEVAMVEDGVVRLYEHQSCQFEPGSTFFTLYGNRPGEVETFALLDGNFDYISGQAKALQEEGLEGAEVCFISREGATSWDF